jgi:hypothetical protein
MKNIKLNSKDLEKTLNKHFKDYKSETIFYNQSLSSDYKKIIYDNDNNIIAIFYSDILFDNCKLIIY